jgi:hypothetical protein
LGDINSSGGIGDEAIVAIEGWDEMMKEVEEKRKAFLDSITPCPTCGSIRVAMKRWLKPRMFTSVNDLTKPPIKCPNPECIERPRVKAPDQW